jgi:cell division protein FtsL
MRVQFDLRPTSLLEKERKRTSFNPMRILVTLLLLVFFASSGAYIVLMTLNMFSLRTSVEEKTYEVENKEGQKAALEAEIRRLAAQEAVYASTLKIMQDDLPTLEVLNAFEEHMDYGMGLNTLRFGNSAPGGTPVTVDATSATEAQIIALYDGLMGSGVFTPASAGMTNSRRDDRTGRVSFTLSLVAFPIGQIRSPE